MPEVRQFVTVNPIRFNSSIVELFQCGQLIGERKEERQFLAGLSVQLLSGSAEQNERVLFERLNMFRPARRSFDWPISEPLTKPVLVESTLMSIRLSIRLPIDRSPLESALFLCRASGGQQLVPEAQIVHENRQYLLLFIGELAFKYGEVVNMQGGRLV